MFSVAKKVVVKAGFIRRFFGAKPKTGFIALTGIGKYSKQPIYTVFFDGGGVGEYFEKELDVAPIARNNLDGIILH